MTQSPAKAGAYWAAVPAPDGLVGAFDDTAVLA